MKKSEMIDHMAAEIEEYLLVDNVKARRTAERLLDMMLGFGMLPPMIQGKPLVMGYDSRTGEAAGYDVTGRITNQWEMEEPDLKTFKAALAAQERLRKNNKTSVTNDED